MEVVDGKLQAQGVNTGPNDGAPDVRDYVNAIHDHWSNVESLGIATATLPGFDVTPSAGTALLGQDLELSLQSVRKWIPPHPTPTPGAAPHLEPLSPGQLITVQGPTGAIDSDSLGGLTLIEDVPFGGASDLDLVYAISELPAGEIHVLEFLLRAITSTGEPSAIATSAPIHILLSPDGSDPVTRLHHASLFLERYVATIPEPSTGGMLMALAVAIVTPPRARVDRR